MRCIGGLSRQIQVSFHCECVKSIPILYMVTFEMTMCCSIWNVMTSFQRVFFIKNLFWWKRGEGVSRPIGNLFQLRPYTVYTLWSTGQLSQLHVHKHRTVSQLHVHKLSITRQCINRRAPPLEITCIWLLFWPSHDVNGQGQDHMVFLLHFSYFTIVSISKQY